MALTAFLIELFQFFLIHEALFYKCVWGHDGSNRAC